MGTRYWALLIGIIYVVVAIMGFIPGLVQPATNGDPSMAGMPDAGLLLGLFPVNLLHTLIHLIVGVWGILAFSRYTRARQFSRVMTVVVAILTIMGLIPGLDTLFGLAPLYGLDVALHGLTALISAYFGFVVTVGEPAYSDTRAV